MFSNFVKVCLATVAFAADGVYDYKQLGADWGQQAGNELCDHGSQQSPINFTDEAEGTWGLAINLKPNTYIDYTTATIEKLTHTIQVGVNLGQMELVFD